MEVRKEIKRTEEVDHIVNRMPNRFGVQVTIIATAIVSILLVLGFLISYPDIQIGTATINTETPAMRIFSNHAGKIILLKQNLQSVEQDEVLGYLDNPANMQDILHISELLKDVDITNMDEVLALSDFPRKVYLGSINNVYYTFLNAMQQYKNYYVNNLYDHQIRTYKSLLHEQYTLLEKTKEKAALSGNNLDILGRFAERDSILLSKRVISVAEFERNKMNQLNAVFSDVNTRNEASQIMLEIFKTQNAINETEIKKEEIEKNLYLTLSSTFHELKATLKQFDEVFVFRTPQTGNLQYLDFWNNNYFVQSGEPVFSIVPSNNKIVAQVRLPNIGAGKVEIGQEVIIKLDNYPFNEFGSLTGTVRDISLVTNTQRTQQGDIESYLVHVGLPGELITNYGNKLEFKYELKGIAEIVTKKRMLIERAFDNIRYMLSEKQPSLSAI
ncbi:HlyD family efflux transporter periplasmic adaptor subunit [Sphingobacterium phlebotomi]|uniref:HlyD family efflux transporter periplasmic adaptor subunit n=1 Tax=Sphingobacterium phlebotomi TaxID=2605433 RepID=A0A5D4GXF1_9SPHI|nr:HlyD family efflux transporter periplasmic adaptor subunit [Sphingobacterium phlebotomi]TYR31240.1 HlyD family efflux transporter periplasmic adaptor subunit [Sphingobacterium phlebotomi]